MSDLKILSGGCEIARHLFGDSNKAKRIYRLSATAGLPTFMLGGTMCARPDKLDAWLAEQEAAGSEEIEAA